MAENHLTPHTHCTACGSNQFTVIKKGFKGSEALGAFAFLLLVMFGLTWIYATDHPDLASPQYKAIGNLLLALSAVLPLAGLLAGTRHMNDLYRVCHHCGNETPVEALKTAPATSTLAAAATAAVQPPSAPQVEVDANGKLVRRAV